MRQVSNTFVIHSRYIANTDRYGSIHGRYIDNTCDTQTIHVRHAPGARYFHTRCPVFSHTGICKHVLAVNHCKEKGKPQADQRQSLNLRLLARSLYVAKGKSEKGRKRGGGTGYRMKTKALEPQRANEKRAHRKKTVVAKKTNKPAKTINKAASKSKATKSKATVSSKSKASKSKATKSKATVSSKSQSKASKSKPKPATPTKTKASKAAPAPLRPMGQYADGTTRFIEERKKRRIQDSDDEDEEPDHMYHPF